MPERPERPVEPYSWDKDHLHETMLEEWYEYVCQLEEYADRLETNAKAAQPKAEKEKLFSICYHEVLGRTIYVRAKDRDEARTKAERHFDDDPLTPWDDYIDSSMEIDEIDQKGNGIEDEEIIG